MAALLPDVRGSLSPPLKWAGGKRWLVPHLMDIWGAHRRKRLVEPFCGGLAVALGLSPERALLNDINPHAINFYRQLSSGLQSSLAMRNDEELYYAHRARFNDLIRAGEANGREAAELFYFLNRTGYNGLCRFNKRGEFNVPFGRYTTITYRRDWSDYRPMLSRWTFTTGDFESADLRRADFVYADPPYDVPFTQYAKETFGWNDQVRLAEWLASHTGPVVLSNQATPRIVKLYKDLGFKLHSLEAPRMISCTGDRTKAKEVLATKGL